MKQIDYNSNVNQEIKTKFVSREVIYCVSTLVNELAKKAEHFRDYEDDLYGAYRGIPDYEEAATQSGWIKIENSEEDIFFSNEETKEQSDVETWEELCNEQAIDLDDYTPEIYEHWIVTDWLADKLENHGEKVLKDFFGMTIWCRTTTGQAILLDGVISEICAEMEILEGQQNDWSK
jgi:hypothetical protein